VALLKNLTTNEVKRFDLSFVDIHCHDTNIVTDMTSLHSLSEPTILYNLQQRSLNKSPYTYMGTVLISCNPFEWYSFPNTTEYSGKVLDPSKPHPYAIAGRRMIAVKIRCSRQMS
jgi:myosin heavy subunit